MRGPRVHLSAPPAADCERRAMDMGIVGFCQRSCSVYRFILVAVERDYMMIAVYGSGKS